MFDCGGLNIYAIIETGGKQYRVTQGKTIDVDRLDVAEGASVELDKVLLIAEGEKVTVGTPTVTGAKVLATSQGESKGKKITTIKFTAKSRYTKKIGHRQSYTKLLINQIVGPGATPEKPKRTRRSKKEVTESGS